MKDINNIPKAEFIDKDNNLYYNKVRTQQQIQARAEEMAKVAQEYVVTPSKWSGKIIVNNDLIDNHATGQKEWNCDITVVDYATDGTLLHELLHSHSVSHL